MFLASAVLLPVAALPIPGFRNLLHIEPGVAITAAFAVPVGPHG